jgi:hypothetical protein
MNVDEFGISMITFSMLERSTKQLAAEQLSDVTDLSAEIQPQNAKFRQESNFWLGN